MLDHTCSPLTWHIVCAPCLAIFWGTCEGKDLPKWYVCYDRSSLRYSPVPLFPKHTNQFVVFLHNVATDTVDHDTSQFTWQNWTYPRLSSIFIFFIKMWSKGIPPQLANPTQCRNELKSCLVGVTITQPAADTGSKNRWPTALPRAGYEMLWLGKLPSPSLSILFSLSLDPHVNKFKGGRDSRDHLLLVINVARFPDPLCGGDMGSLIRINATILYWQRIWAFCQISNKW